MKTDLNQTYLQFRNKNEARTQAPPVLSMVSGSSLK